MNPLTGEWVAKAEGDLRTAQRELQATESPNYDAVCFHAQQCAEKYLKARLIEAHIRFPKIHDLGAMLDLLRPIEPEWESLRGRLDSLTDIGVEVRYPGRFGDEHDARMAVATAEHVRNVVRASLGLEA